MADQTFEGSTPKICTVDAGSGAGKQYCAVCFVAGTEDNVTLPAAANAGRFAGFAQADFVAGDRVLVHMAGGISRVLAAAAFQQGDRLMIADNQGRLKPATNPQQNQVDAGLVASANAVTLSKAAAGLAAVQVLTGTVTGAFTPIPRGIAPTVTKTCSLSADGTKVNFLAGDAVLTASVEYVLQSPPQCEVVAVATGIAANANDVAGALPLHATQQG